MSTDVQVTWIGPGLRMEGKGPEGHSIVMDHVLPGEEREEHGIRPMRLVLLGMAGCTAMDVVSILQKKRQAVTGMQVDVTADRADEHPRVYTRVHLEYVVAGQEIAAQAVERAIELSVSKYCSAIAMISSTAEITTSYRIVAESGTAAQNQFVELERRIAELRARLPKHSAPVSMLMELDELDAELERARGEVDQGNQA